MVGITTMGCNTIVGSNPIPATNACCEAPNDFFKFSSNVFHIILSSVNREIETAHRQDLW